MVVLRSFIIAVRYGFASEFRIKMLKTHKQDLSFIAKDLLLPTWMNFNPKGLELEIEAALWRNQIDDEKFKISFIEELSEEIEKSLSDKNYYDKVEFTMSELKSSLKVLNRSIKLKQFNSGSEI